MKISCYSLWGFNYETESYAEFFAGMHVSRKFLRSHWIIKILNVENSSSYPIRPHDGKPIALADQLSGELPPKSSSHDLHNILSATVRNPVNGSELAWQTKNQSLPAPRLPCLKHFKWSCIYFLISLFTRFYVTLQRTRGHVWWRALFATIRISLRISYPLTSLLR